MTTYARNSRLDAPLVGIRDGEDLTDCMFCQRRTWPMGTASTGHRIEQCLHCGQRYDVEGADVDEDNIDAD